MKHFIIAAAVAAAAFVAAAAPAHAHHDTVCLPTAPLPPVCVAGVEHDVEDIVQTVDQTEETARDTAWAAVLEAWPTITGPVVDGYSKLEAIPEPVCVPGRESCVSGIRAVAQYLYFGGVSLTFSVSGYMLCAAIQPDSCPPPLWLVPKP